MCFLSWWTLIVPSLKNTSHWRTLLTEEHISPKNTSHCRTHLTEEHFSLKNTSHRRTRLTADHISLKNTSHWRTHLTEEHVSLQITSHWRTLLTEEHFSITCLMIKLPVLIRCHCNFYAQEFVLPWSLLAYGFVPLLCKEAVAMQSGLLESHAWTLKTALS